MSVVSGFVVSNESPPRTATLLRYVPVLRFSLRSPGNWASRGDKTPFRSSLAPYHPPVSEKCTVPDAEPRPRLISAPNWGGILLSTNDWNAAIPLAATAALRFHVYSKMVAEAGAGNVLTSIEVVIPKDAAEPRKPLKDFD